MKEPWFWREKTLAARLVAASLSPAAIVYDAGRRLRAATTRPRHAPAPVICIGNATLGGVGKTPFALMLQNLLTAKNIKVHFLTRGYGGALKGPCLVDPVEHSSFDVGDEALLLAAAAPTWLSHDRPAGALAAGETGAEAIIMDDGFQNPSIGKTLSFLLIDAGDPAGNGRVFPAGPLREPEEEALSRASALVYILKDKTAPRPAPSSSLPTFYCWLEATGDIAPNRVVAFAGVGRPQRFFDTLQRAGFELAASIGYPDHHAYDEAAIDRLRKLASARSAHLITTEKDFVRMNAALREGIDVFRVRMTCDAPDAVSSLALKAITDFAKAESAAHV